MTRAIGFNQQKADTICERLASGLSLRAICRNKGMPSKSTVWVLRVSTDEIRRHKNRSSLFIICNSR